MQSLGKEYSDFTNLLMYCIALYHNIAISYSNADICIVGKLLQFTNVVVKIKNDGCLELQSYHVIVRHNKYRTMMYRMLEVYVL